jgi:hypothetical protein
MPLRLPPLPKGLARPWTRPTPAVPPRRWTQRLPLRCTLLATTALVVLPAVLLVRLPRPRAEGLGRLLPLAALLQGFPGAPERAVPQLWQQRLPAPLAERFWRQQRQPWWQLWAQDGSVGAYLVMPTPRPIRIGAQQRPANSLEVDGLMVVAPNSFSLNLLSQKLRSAPRQQRGLQQRCLELLERRQSAFWSIDGLNAMAGALAPLLQTFQEGCVELKLADGALQFEGEASDIAGLLAQLPPPGGAARPLPAQASLPDPLPANLLLQVNGRSMQPLLAGLLGRELIREPLITAYGLSDADIKLLKDSPFQLSLRPLATGPFQAGLELVVAPRGDRTKWTRMLDGISERLYERGLLSVAETATSWRDADERIVGGWRWLPTSGKQPLLQLFLGPEPPPYRTALVTPEQWQSLPTLQLQARPAALGAASLLPLQLPMPMQQADQLLVLAESPGSSRSAPSRLLGRMAITRRPSVPQPQTPPPGIQPQPQPQRPVPVAP